MQRLTLYQLLLDAKSMHWPTELIQSTLFDKNWPLFLRQKKGIQDLQTIQSKLVKFIIYNAMACGMENANQTTWINSYFIHILTWLIGLKAKGKFNGYFYTMRKRLDKKRN